MPTNAVVCEHYGVDRANFVLLTHTATLSIRLKHVRAKKGPDSNVRRPGSGKSTMARLLRPYLASGAVVVDHDVLRSAFLASGLAFAAAAHHAYALQWTLADDLMRQGLSVIVDSTCNFPETLARGAALAASHGHGYWYVECRVRDVNVLDGRLRSRAAPMLSQRTAVDGPPPGGADAGEDGRARFARWMESPCRLATTDNVIVVDATGEPEMLRDEILKRIFGSTG